eukprot:jgi/Phyca11/113211/e_gw1.23.476.1
MTCDFERGLINAVRDQFPDATIIGCLFHFKQAVRRNMQKLRIPVEETKTMMKRGFLDSLTVMSHDRIDPDGFQYVIKKFRAALDGNGTEYSSDKWTQFWEYFRKTWIEMYPPNLWNINGVTRTIVNRTNNPLERYNRELNVAFPNSRPNIPTFIGTIERHASRYVSLLEGIAHNRASAPIRGTYIVPDEFNL